MITGTVGWDQRPVRVHAPRHALMLHMFRGETGLYAASLALAAQHLHLPPLYACTTASSSTPPYRTPRTSSPAPCRMSTRGRLTLIATSQDMRGVLPRPPRRTREAGRFLLLPATASSTLPSCLSPRRQLDNGENKRKWHPDTPPPPPSRPDDSPSILLPTGHRHPPPDDL